MRFVLVGAVVMALGCAAPKGAERPVAVAGPMSEPSGCDHVFEEREARYFAQGGVPLGAAWLTPKGVRSFPAAVILQGSGASDRKNPWARQVASALVRCGVGVLLTDKRGSGASSGDWRSASMLDLAADGVAGLHWVLQQPGVDAARVGFVGLSQGGQVAPAAAVASSEADFVISLVAGAGLWHSMVHELAQTYREHGVPEPQVAYLQQLSQVAHRYLTTGEGWEDYLRLHKEIASGPLARAAETWPTDPADPYWVFWRKNHAFDPVPYWAQAVGERGMRGLAILGAEDKKNVDVPHTVQRLTAEVPRGRMQVEVIPGVGHSLRAESGDLHPRVVALMVDAVTGADPRP